MERYVSFLRGINVGGRTVRMSDLKDCYQSLGLSDIQTYLQSGNVSFSSDQTDENQLTQDLQNAISKTFNYPAKVFVFSEQKLKSIVASYPFKNQIDNFQYYVIFLDDNLAPRLYKEGMKLESKIDEISLGKEVLYWKVPKGETVNSPFSKLLVKSEFKEYNTVRNIKTLSKMLT